MISFLTRLKKSKSNKKTTKSNETNEKKKENNLKQNDKKIAKSSEPKEFEKKKRVNKNSVTPKSNDTTTKVSKSKESAKKKRVNKNNATAKSTKTKSNDITTKPNKAKKEKKKKKKKTPGVTAEKTKQLKKKKTKQKKPQKTASDKKPNKKKKGTENRKKANSKKENKNTKRIKNKSDKTPPKNSKKKEPKTPKKSKPKSANGGSKKKEPKSPVTKSKDSHKQKKKQQKKTNHKQPKQSKQSEKRNQKQRISKNPDGKQSTRTKTKEKKSKTKKSNTAKQNTKKSKKEKAVKDKEQRKSEQIEKDIETAKRRLSKRLSQKSIVSTASDMDRDEAHEGKQNMDKIKTDSTHCHEADITSNIWSDYLRKFGNEPQNVSELQTFCKTESKYSTMNYKQCKDILDAHRSNEPEDNLKDMKNKRERDQNYMKRDIHSAKKRFNRRESAKPKIPSTLLRDDSSWIVHKDEKRSVDLITDNIETQKRLYLDHMLLGDSHTVEKKKKVSSLFQKHMEIAKRNSALMPNGAAAPLAAYESPESPHDAISPHSLKLHQRLKDEKEAMENAIPIVRDLGFLKYIKDNDVYSKIYRKRCDDYNDFDMFDMNNMDVLSRFEEKTRMILSKVICKAIVSIPSLEIVEICNADIDDNFMEVFIGYLLKYYHLNNINSDMNGKRIANISILSLQSNPISDRGMMSLCRLIRRNYDVLHTIKLQNNRKDISTAVCEEICKSLEQNEHIIKFEFEFRHYEWRDFRDKVIKRNAEKSRIMKLEIQRVRLILKVMESLEDHEFEAFIASFGRSKLISILYTGLMEEIRNDKMHNVNKMNAVIAQIRND